MIVDVAAVLTRVNPESAPNGMPVSNELCEKLAQDTVAIVELIRAVLPQLTSARVKGPEYIYRGSKRLLISHVVLQVSISDGRVDLYVLEDGRFSITNCSGLPMTNKELEKCLSDSRAGTWKRLRAEVVDGVD
jgi:hypothetical protein